MATRREAAVHALALMLGAALLAGCGGGGGAASSSPGGGVTTPAPPSGQPVSLTIFLPNLQAGSAARRPAYAPPNSTSLTISINGAAGGSYDISATSPSCKITSGGRTCTFTVDAPPGSDTFALTVWDGPGGTGHALSSGSATQAIVLGVSNALTVPLSGIVAQIALTLANPNPPQGTATSIPMTVTARDADGNVIATCSSCPQGDNQYANPLTLSDSDTTNTSIVVNGAAGTTVRATSDTVAVTYDGSSLSTAVLFSASAAGVSASDVTGASLSPYGSIVLVPSTVTFTSTSNSQSVQVSQAGFTGNFTVSAPACTGIATVGSGSGNPLTVTVTPVGAGTCSATISGGFSKTATLSISVTTTTITVQ